MPIGLRKGPRTGMWLMKQLALAGAIPFALPMVGDRQVCARAQVDSALLRNKRHV